MTVLRDAVGRIGLAWTPAYTTIAIVALAVVVGFLPFVKMSLVVNGVFLGAIIALGAIGLTIVYGLLNFANVAHGDYMTMGAYVALFIVVGVLPSLGIEGSGLGPFTFGYPVLIALPIAVAIVAAGAIVLDVTIYRRLRARGVNAVVMSMASLGIAIALRGLVQVIWTGEVQHFPRESRQVFHLPMDVRVPPDAIFIAILAVILVAAVYVILTRTRMGKAMRATADNPDLALVSGIDTRQVIWWAWGMAAALSATAGILLGRVPSPTAAHHGMEVPHSPVRRGYPGRLGQPLRRARRRVRHRRHVRGIDPVAEPQLQAGGRFRHHDYHAAGKTSRNLRGRKELTATASK